MNDYYVYIYWRLDTNEVFYVGKGHNNRWKRLSRENKHFKNIINKHPIVCEIIKDNLSESEAFYWEEEIIRILVFEYGYSINIKHNKSIEKSCHLVNATWGGEGVSGYHFSENTKEKMSKSHIGIQSKENHPMWGKNPRDYMSEKTKKERDRKAGESLKGKNNPRYGVHLSNETKEKLRIANSGRNSGKAKSVICLTTKRIFFTSKEGSKYYNCNHGHISQCCKGKLKSCGKLNRQKLVWRYIVWNHGKIYRIKE